MVPSELARLHWGRPMCFAAARPSFATVKIARVGGWIFCARLGPRFVLGRNFLVFVRLLMHLLIPKHLSHLFDGMSMFSLLLDRLAYDKMRFLFAVDHVHAMCAGQQHE